MHVEKLNVDIMFQTDFESTLNPSKTSQYTNTNKIQSKSIEIAPKYFEMQLSSKSAGSHNIFRTPRLIKKKFDFEKHAHETKSKKPLESIYHNPIISLPRERKIKYRRLPEIRMNATNSGAGYFNQSKYSMTLANRFKYSNVLDSYHLSR